MSNQLLHWIRADRLAGLAIVAGIAAHAAFLFRYVSMSYVDELAIAALVIFLLASNEALLRYLQFRRTLAAPNLSLEVVTTYGRTILVAHVAGVAGADMFLRGAVQTWALLLVVVVLLWAFAGLSAFIPRAQEPS
ncbi:MAG: hypothetical protein QM750_19770 [Rubrivivax sp.]